MAAGGSNHLRVLYDYEYEASDGTPIKFTAGEECRLVKKTNSEWWYVLRPNEKKPLYVPANYVEPVKAASPDINPRKKKPPPKPPAKPKLPKPSMEEEVLKELDSILNDALDEDIPLEGDEEEEDAPFYANTASDAPSTAEEKPQRPATPEPDYEGARSEDSSPPVPLLRMGMRAGSETSGYKTDSRESLDSPVPAAVEAHEQPQYANISSLNDQIAQSESLSPETDNQPNYANLEEIQQSIHLASAKAGSKRDAADSASAEPSTAAASHRRPVQVNSFGTPVFLTNDVAENESTRISEGWKEEKMENGDIYYVHENSNEKWFSATDGTGRQYFYKEGSSTTSWSLPKVSTHPLLSRRHGSLDNVPALADEAPPSQPSGIPASVPLPPSIKRHQVRASWAAGETGPLGAGWKRILPPSVPTIAGPTLAGDGLKEEEPEGEEGTSSPLVPPKHLSMLLELGPSSPKRGLRRTPDYENCTPLESPSDASVEEPPPEMLEKSGILNKTKLTDSSGKKVKKSWSSSYVVAQGNQLVLYKDQKAAQPKSSSSLARPEISLDLVGATVQLHMAAKDLSSKKNFIQLTLAEGEQYLLQSDKDATIQEWYNILQHNTTTLVPIQRATSVNSLEDSLESPGNSLERGVSLSPTDKSHARKGSKKSDRPKTPEGELEKNKVKLKLIKWLLRRPTLESLQEKGIIRDGVFGAHILTICEREKSSVPQFVTDCIQAVEARGLDVDGMYRVNGNMAQMQKLRFLVDQNQPYNLLEADWDVHVISGALKLFFRELREPLIPFSFFNKFIDCNKITDRGAKDRALRDLVKRLPPQNAETLRVLCKHFAKVIEHSQTNRMQAHNMAIVFGPTLMWPALESSNMAVTLVCQNQLVEIFILDQSRIFT